MSIVSLLVAICGFLLLVIFGMLVGFIIRETSFSRQLDAIRQMLIVTSETSAQTVELVEVTIQTMNAVREDDRRQNADLLERVKDTANAVNNTIVPILSRLEGANRAGTTHNSFIANPQNSQVNAGSNTGVDQNNNRT